MVEKRYRSLLVYCYVVSWACHSCIVVALYLAICLQMISRGSQMFDDKIRADGCEEVSDKLTAVVGQEICWNAI